ncbi:3-dehydroshikimate dehydratase [Gammaproteobacteria bacterium 45_16_T64]|nr:3-dehydroshikimate dehydratase [Gammaproteobacteria bacterium 45_16_T64]
MNLSICTISFRHELISIDQLANWAKTNNFQAIELWGAHALNLADQPNYGQDWLSGFNLHCSMISDYLPLQGPEHEVFSKVHHLCRLANHWGASKLRTFAGQKGSAETSPKERAQIIQRLSDICTWAEQHSITLIVETHPNTLADSVDSTHQLIKEVAHDNLKINFDVLHVWESGADPIVAVDQLAPHIQHFHLKNISSEKFLDVFLPPNVYAASGTREGMVPVFEGAVNYETFLEHLIYHHHSDLWEMDASLEWFGHQAKKVLRNDRYQLQKLEQQCQLGHVISQ